VHATRQHTNLLRKPTLHTDGNLMTLWVYSRIWKTEYLSKSKSGHYSNLPNKLISMTKRAANWL